MKEVCLSLVALILLSFTEGVAYGISNVVVEPVVPPPPPPPLPLFLEPPPPMVVAPGMVVAPPAPPLPVAHPQSQFVSTVQIAVQENSPILLRRSQNLAMAALANVFDSWPELTGRRYEIKKVGNEIVAYLVTNEDMRLPMQKAVARLFADLSDKTRARGRYLFYRTSLAHPIGGYGVVVDDTHSHILSISAQSVPMRDLLKDMRSKLGSLSYLIPGDCADRVVDWTFGMDSQSKPKSVDATMAELATLFDLKLVKQNGTYIFNGNCHQSSLPRAFPATDLLPSRVMPGNQGYRATQVFFPLAPLGE